MPRAKDRPRIDTCATHAHPNPTMDEREQIHAGLKAAIDAVGEAYGFANKTPSYHYLTEDLTEAIVLLSRIGRTI